MPGTPEHLNSTPYRLSEGLDPPADERASEASSALGQILEAQLPLLTAPLCVAQ